MISMRRVAGVAVCLFILCARANAGLILPGDIVAEATGPGGAIVGYTVLVQGAGGDGGDGRQTETVTCSPASLSLFPLGNTTVSCSGSEGSTGSFLVSVVDRIRPVLSLPGNIAVATTNTSGQPVTYTASATDAVDGTVPISCTPPSGATFPFGITTVSCTASDAAGNSSSGFFTVTLAVTPPPPVNPLDITAEATSPDGAAVLFSGDGEDDGGRTGTGCSPASGTVFPLGVTTVTCPSSTFNVTVVDTTPPTLSLPVTVTAASSTPIAVTFTATATDLVDGSVSVDCTPASGSLFPLGTTPVSCSATDSHGNGATGSFSVIVAPNPPPPAGPDDIIAEATSAAGAVVTYVPGPGPFGRETAICSPASGSTFPLGATTVVCDSGKTFTVTVVDTTPPDLTVPTSFTLEATSAAGAVATFTATATDLVDGSVSPVCLPASGSTFPLGASTVSCTATDLAGNASNGQFTITVVDTTPPQITSLTASPANIWSPDNKLTTVTVTAQVTEAVDPSPVVRIFNITCNETIAAGDAIITGPLTAQLRDARDPHGTGRVYTIWVEAIDASGNRSTSTTTVGVPLDQRKRAVAP